MQRNDRAPMPAKDVDFVCEGARGSIDCLFLICEQREIFPFVLCMRVSSRGFYRMYEKDELVFIVGQADLIIRILQIPALFFDETPPS